MFFVDFLIFLCKQLKKNNMLTIACSLVGHYQLVTSWLISFGKMFTTCTANNDVIVITVEYLTPVQLSCLDSSGAAFIITEFQTDVVLLVSKEGAPVNPAHLIQ